MVVILVLCIIGVIVAFVFKSKVGDFFIYSLHYESQSSRLRKGANDVRVPNCISAFSCSCVAGYLAIHVYVELHLIIII